MKNKKAKHFRKQNAHVCIQAFHFMKYLHMVDFRFHWRCVPQNTLHFIREVFLKIYFSPACIMIKYKK